MKTVSRVGRGDLHVAHGEAGVLGRADHAHEHAVGAAHGELHRAVERGRGVDALDGRLEPPRQLLEIAVGVHGHDRVGADRLLELLRRAEREDLAVIHDADAVAELVGLLHVVRRQDDRLAGVVQAADDLPEADPALRVEAGGGLVEEQDRRVVEDRARDHQPLGEAARERHHRRLGALGEVELDEQVVGGGARGGGAHAEEAAVEVEVLPHGERAVERVRLRHDADQLLGDRGVRDDVDVVHERLSRRRDHARGQHARGGGLAGAVGAEQPEDLALGDGQVEPVDRGDAARVDLGQIDGADDIGRGGSGR